MASATVVASLTSPSEPAAPVAPVAPAGIPNVKAKAPDDAVKLTLTVGLAPALNPLAVALVLTTLPSVVSSAVPFESNAISLLALFDTVASYGKINGPDVPVLDVVRFVVDAN